MTFVLGVTGGIGSGKTAVTDRLSTFGIEVIDADIIAHQLVEPNTLALQTISEHFGKTVLLDSGELNRAKLREIIFTAPEEKHWLESLLHPLIRQTIKDRIKTAKPPYCVLVAPLLLEGSLHKLTDNILVVDCSKETQIRRASQRDNSNKESIERIIDQQISRTERLAKADMTINNEGSIDELNQQVDSYHHQLINKLLKFND